jgi:AraC family ethanolamine operon transcriptional activator
MPTRIFASFEAFFAANAHSDLRGMVLGRKQEDWVMTQLTINNLSVQWGRAGASVIVEGAAKPGGVSLFIPTGSPFGISGNGCRLDESALMVIQTGDDFCIANDASRRWFSLYIPNETLAGPRRDPKTSALSMHGYVKAPLQRIDGFRSIIDQFDQAVQRAASDFDSAAAQNAAEQKLIQAMRDVLTVQIDVEPPPGRHIIPRKEIIRRSIDFLDRHECEYLSMEQLAVAANVSERTLRDAYQHYFGVSPVRYLNRRTLHNVRAALKSADPNVTTVTQIVTEFGVWQLGRFARDYRSLFCELPSETLHRR